MYKYSNIDIEIDVDTDVDIDRDIGIEDWDILYIVRQYDRATAVYITISIVYGAFLSFPF